MGHKGDAGWCCRRVRTVMEMDGALSEFNYMYDIRERHFVVFLFAGRQSTVPPGPGIGKTY